MTARSKARIHKPSRRTLARLARALQAGELVAVPTETVYGLAANALDAAACRKIFRAKGRPTTDPLIVHIHETAQLDSLCEMNDVAWRLAGAFWPGPLTMVLPKKVIVPDIVTAGRDSVAIRMPAHAVFRRLLKLASVPLAAPSANPFGYVSPTTAQHVLDHLGRRIRHILDGGPARIGLESTIVDVREPRHPRLLRPGAITRQQLEDALGLRVRVVRTRKRQAPKLPAGYGRHEIADPEPAAVKSGEIAPGMLSRHYSPRTPVILHDDLQNIWTKAPANHAREAFVFLRRPRFAARAQNIFWLDAHGELRGVARRLFAMLRKVDSLGFERMHVELAHGEGLASAINDRLRRAATR